MFVAVILPDTTASSGGGTGVELDQQLMPQHATGTTPLHPTSNTASGLTLPRYSGPDFLSGPRSLSDSSTAESPVGNDDVLQSNGQTTGFHHHHVHHHNSSSTSYPGSHYPVLPASLLYSQLYHSSGSDLLGATANTRQQDDAEQRCGVNTVVSPQQRTQDHSAVWRPYWPYPSVTPCEVFQSTHFRWNKNLFLNHFYELWNSHHV